MLIKLNKLKNWELPVFFVFKLSLKLPPNRYCSLGEISDEKRVSRYTEVKLLYYYILYLLIGHKTQDKKIGNSCVKFWICDTQFVKLDRFVKLLNIKRVISIMNIQKQINIIK